MSKVERKHLKKLDKIIDALQLGDPIIVPVRKKGKLCKGVLGKCHMNVCEVVKHLGGKQVIGYFVQRENPVTALLHHSIWLSPEGKYVDVTYGDIEERDEIYFYPLKTYDPLTEYYSVRNNWYVPDNIHKGIRVEESSGNNYIVPLNFFKKISQKRKELKKSNQLEKAFNDVGFQFEQISLVKFDDYPHSHCESQKNYINEFKNNFNFKNYQNDERSEAI